MLQFAIKTLFRRSLLSIILTLLSLTGRAQDLRQITPPELSFSFEQRFLITQLLALSTEPVSKREQRMQEFVQDVASRLAAGQRQGPLVVETFADYLKLRKGEWPSSMSLTADIEQLKISDQGFRQITSVHPEIQTQIQQYENRVQEKLLAMISTDELQTIKSWLQHFSPATNSIDRTKIIAHFSDPRFHKMLTRSLGQIAGQFIGAQTKKLDSLGSEVAAQVHLADPALRIVIPKTISMYFKNLGQATKLQMISAQMGLPIEAKIQDRFLAMVQESGPQFQKLLQVLGRANGLSSEMRTLFQQLESNVKAVPDFQVRQILASHGENFNETFMDLKVEKKPLGVGTMAQVNPGTMRINGDEKQVAVRFIKPGLDARVQEDSAIIKLIAKDLDADPRLRELNFPLIGPSVQSISDAVFSELNMKKTIESQQRARSVYKWNFTDFSFLKSHGLNVQISVPEVFNEEWTPSSKLMVQERVAGKSLDSFIKKEFSQLTNSDQQRIRSEIIDSLALQWMGEAFFGEGFFHADPHHGNLLVGRSGTTIKATLLDYGMTGQLSVLNRSLMLNLAVALKLGSPAAVTKCLWGLSEGALNRISFSDLSRRVAERLNEPSQTKTQKSLENWMGWSTEIGLQYPESLINFNRGLGVIETLIKETNPDASTAKVMAKLMGRHWTTALATFRAGQQLSFIDVIVAVKNSVEFRTRRFAKNIWEQTQQLWNSYQFRRARCEAVFVN
jgi:ubiquinone biosynthesis protein